MESVSGDIAYSLFTMFTDIIVITTRNHIIHSVSILHHN